MAIFTSGSSGNKPAPPAPVPAPPPTPISVTAPTEQRPATRLDPAPNDGTVSVIAPGLRVVGDVETAGVVKVEGTIEGAVKGARQVLLGRSGVIHGDVYSQEAVIGGKVVGKIVASDRVELQGTATVEGDIQTKSIVVFEGACINGSVRMGDTVAAPAARASGSQPSVRLAKEG